MQYLAVDDTTYVGPTLDDPIVAHYTRHEHHWQIEIIRPEELRASLELNSPPARGREDEGKVREMISTWLGDTSGHGAPNGAPAA